MALQPGATLGPYEILSLIGAGGMGEVYRARDSRLGREVAIKVLPHDRVADEARRQRFIQEAKAASALNHPHIITIHEIEFANGIDFLVMEYVRGKSLDAVIPRQGMRLAEALRIAIAVADAVECAHRHKIVHRDLKPANVMIGTDGAVKVLDFGLAKLLSDDESDRDAMTRTVDPAITRRGAIVGTLAYMSPEQASGEAADARSDVFSFGVMLYEMVTGERAFVGKTPTDTLAAVLRAQPKSPIELVPTLPHELERLILRCLRREPERRFQHMVDVKVDLQEIKEESDSGVAPPPLVPRGRWGAAVAIGVLAVVVTGAGAWLLKRSPAVVPPLMRAVPLTSMTGHAMWPAFSPDGQQVAFAWQPEGHDNFDIYIKLVGLEDVRRLTADPANDDSPSWSRDGRQIAFARSGTIHLVSPIGGGERKLSDFAVGAPIAWSPDGRYVAAGGDDWPGHAGVRRGIYLIPAAGGAPRLITPTGEDGHGPAFSLDGRRLAYSSCKETSYTDCALRLVDLDTEFIPTGPSRALTPQAPFMTWGIAWSHDGGSVIYGALDAGVTSLWRVRVDEDRPPERIEFGGGDAAWPAIAPSGDRLAFSRNLDAHAPYRFEPGRPSRPMLTSSLFEGNLDFSPDGQRIAYCAEAGGAVEVWTAKVDGATPQQLTHGPGRWQCSPRWSPKGERVVFDSEAADGRWHIWSISADGGTARQETRDEGSQNVPSWSRDGQWIYYSSDGNVFRIHVTDGRKQRLTSEGGVFVALESADGRNLLYNHDRGLLSVPLTGGSSRQIAPCVVGWAVASTSRGIYYAACSGEESGWGGSNPALHLVNAATGEDRVLGTLEKFSSFGLFGMAVSPDGRDIVYDRLLREGHDLMLIENFR